MDTMVQKQPRRVGSWTLGLTLILCGVCFLLYYFWPGFDYVAVAKLAPLLLIGLGAEILYFSARPERGRYDFLSILSCLFLMVCSFCVTLIPTFWQYVGPARSTAAHRVEQEGEEALYQVLQGSDVYNLSLRLYWTDYTDTIPDSLAALNGSEEIWADVELRGDYTDAAAFAAACRQVLDAAKTARVPLYGAYFTGMDAAGAETLYTLDLSGSYQINADTDTLTACVDSWTEPEPVDEAAPEESGEPMTEQAAPDVSAEPDAPTVAGQAA